MARVTVEDSLKKIPNRYVLVLLAAKRAKQLFKGSKPLINPKENKEVVVALREIAAGKAFIKETEEGSGSA